VLQSAGRELVQTAEEERIDVKESPLVKGANRAVHPVFLRNQRRKMSRDYQTVGLNASPGSKASTSFYKAR